MIVFNRIMVGLKHKGEFKTKRMKWNVFNRIMVGLKLQMAAWRSSSEKVFNRIMVGLKPGFTA